MGPQGPYLNFVLYIIPYPEHHNPKDSLTERERQDKGAERQDVSGKDKQTAKEKNENHKHQISNCIALWEIIYSSIFERQETLKNITFQETRKAQT